VVLLKTNVAKSTLFRSSSVEKKAANAGNTEREEERESPEGVASTGSDDVLDH
jgi:hypothetical protein